ncbi:hypothetical protein JTE90_014734 [Oedothorax gibbosus]|uniref:Centromere protein S n=1 Tax=Oedothorax gibbosus TaxID=931172 RepID=A0AAV6USE5_9ARAC|nr:hypothetical protein JTE90_014734 [Oedothorax gibbosus]
MGDFENNSELKDNLQTSLHYSVGKICAQTAEAFNVKFSKQFIATLSDLAFHQTGIFAEDLELFAKHAKRTTVTVDDVKLLVRRSKSLHDHVSKTAAEIASKSTKPKSKKKEIDGESSKAAET